MQNRDLIGDSFVIKGDIIYSEGPQSLRLIPRGYIVCQFGQSRGVYEELPDVYSGLPVLDYSDRLILPGLVDLHAHAPQYSFVGLGMDYELIDWLEKNTFPEEAAYADAEYAKKAYDIFACDLRQSFTTRACIFATIHKQATGILMDLLEGTGLSTMVGKVNMDRNSPDYLCETTEQSVLSTLEWLASTHGKYQRTRSIITPRFIPSCSEELLKALASLCKKFKLPVQSHLSENLGEISWVKSLVPHAEGYADAYRQLGLFGGEISTVMAHCVHLTQAEMELVKENGVYIAHCPSSNANLSSGVAPVRAFLDRGILTGLGTDVAGGDTLSVFRVMAEAVKYSKLRWRLADQSLGPISVDETFYMGTKGGGSFFGKVGSFEAGFEFDALVIDDTRLQSPRNLSLRERFERLIYLSDRCILLDKFCQGRRVELL